MALSHEIGVIGGGSQSTGESDHAALDNLDFPSSNHTGFAPEEHTHEIEDVSGLETALGDIESALGGKEPTLTKGDLTATSPIVLSQTRQVIGGAAAISLEAAYTPRERLLAARTYYVRTDGNDSNTGLVDSAAGAFLTLQAAVNAYQSLDCNGYDVTIKVGDGTYTAGASVTSRVGTGNLNITGNTSTPANVVISTTNTPCVSVVGHPGGSYVIVDGFKVTSTAAQGLYCAVGSVLFFGRIEFGACAQHIFAAAYGTIVSNSVAYTISGNAGFHWYAATYAQIYVVGAFTITLSGTPAFPGYFAYSGTSVVEAHGMTFSGAATGAKYLANLTGVINTSGSGLNYFPGNSDGSTSTGGQYL